MLDIEIIFVLVTIIFISAAIVTVYRLIKKKFFTGIMWIFPAAPIMGFVIMYLTSDSDTYVLMLKDSLVWGFIFAMVYVNIKCLIIGSKRTIRSGKGLYSEIKTEWKKMKPSFKKNKGIDEKKEEKSTKQEASNNEDADNTN